MGIKHPLEGRQLIVEKGTFAIISSLLSQDNDAGTKLLVALSNCTEVKLSHGMKAIHHGHYLAENIIGADIIFTRDYYEDLLCDIRSQFRCVMIGNPGIGKSQFQFYYLARIMNPDLFGELPPDYNGCTDSPKIVVRQDGVDMTVYDIENRVAYKCVASKLLLECFDPKSTLYLYEPGELKAEPFFSGVKLPTLATVSPDSKRYKEFTKNGGLKMFMPTYTSDELSAAGDYLLKQSHLSEAMKDLYSPVNIAKRHDEFGGIFRHVLPSSVKLLQDYYEKRRLAIGNCNAKNILSNINSIEVEDGTETVSSFVMAMIVERSGEGRFRKYKTDFVSVDVQRQVESKVLAVSLEERIVVLMKNDQSGADDVRSRFLYEGVLATMFTTPPGVNWTCKNAQSGKWGEYKLKLKSTIRGSCPKFSDMDCDVLYWPSEDNFPAVEFFYRSVQDRLIAFQVTRQQSNAAKVITESAYRSFLGRVGLEDSTNVTLILAPSPTKANESSINFVPTVKVPGLKADTTLMNMNLEKLLSYASENLFNITYNEFPTKKLFVDELRRLHGLARQSVSTSTITWPEYDVLQIPTDYKRNIEESKGR